MMRDLLFGFSPCPNDTFAFHALVSGCIDTPLRITPVMDDIESLNRRAHRAELPVTKLSFGALARIGGAYVPLRAGAALGHGVGPLLVAREPMSVARAAAGPVAIPGLDTTAHVLLRLALGDALGDVVELRYDEVPDAVARGEVTSGLVIHETRFTYEARGLHRVLDLGEWWEREHAMPVPLAAICARRDVPEDVRRELERVLRASVEAAFADPEASREFVAAHAQELSPATCRSHIELYVNEFTRDLGDEGLAAIEALLAAARGRPAEFTGSMRRTASTPARQQ